MQPEQVGHGGGDVRQAGAIGLLQAQLAAADGVIEDQRHGIERVGGLGLEATVLVLRGLPGLLVELEHFVGVAMVGGDQRYSACRRDCRQQT